jgi:hypothetical protein
VALGAVVAETLPNMTAAVAIAKIEPEVETQVI